MATQLAHAHGHLSNRARVRAALDRKPVFKSVLENPFQISWYVPFKSHRNARPTTPRPSVPANVQNVLLARLMATLENIPCRAHGKIPQQMGISGRQENVDITEENSQALDKVSGASPHFAVGINVVTRALESQLCFTRKHVITDVPSQNRGQLPPPSALSPIETVFVCYADVDPPALVAHIPYLVAGCNSPRNATQPIKLVPLPKGSEQAISQLLGVRRAAVVAFRVWDHNCNCGLPLLMS